MATLDDDLAKAVTEGFRLAQIDIVNQDLILSGTGDVTVTRADGSKKTGPSWSKLIAQAGAAGTSAAAAKTSETNALASKNAAATSATNAATSEGNALASKNAAKTSETNAKTSETNAKTSETNAAASASSAASSLAAAQLLTSVPFETAPFPDVWLPFNDDLRLLAGFAPFDRLTISGQVLELATKSATFTRSTTATYIDKSGVLQTADINEPRFEREGLLMEGPSTNYILNSDDPSKWSGTAAGFGTKSTITDGATQAKTFDGVITATGVNNAMVVISSAITCSAGDFITLSCRFKSAYTDGFMLFRFDAPSGTNQGQVGLYFDGTVGNTTNTSIVDATNTPGPDGYCYGTVTCRAPVDGSYVGRIYFMPKSGTIPVGSEVFVQTVQCEKNAVPTSYIPTGSAAVTRAGEKASLQPSGNVGYQSIGDAFSRTLAFEIAVNRYVTPNVGYADLVRVAGSNNDIIFRAVSSSINSYIGGSGPSVAITYPFGRKVYVQSIDTDNTNTMYFDGKKNSRTLAPTNPASKPTSIDIQSNPNVVYHIRNFRIWHRVLTLNQINGLR
ncbi:hypothetical protein [Leclercia adecarboxylata]|uniref:phage head spike fiber domain-containing protein n=1 Tax=Leclercia adecarboxylata TaxID=83655 RepID=UPI0021F0CC0D|nr:hypothetical protein [Leclercia adecarboxylata]UYM55454.1 hypothetical protein N5937_22495 [Leclercia adecarboxylata]